VTVENKLPMQRRLKTTMLVMISQALLLALAISWVVHMAFIAANGSVNFVENNDFILWSEIIGSALIAIFAILILATQIQRLGERRRSDNREERVRE
jgi:ABC-type nickel/cobalt efflux system permease component RcnA